LHASRAPASSGAWAQVQALAQRTMPQWALAPSVLVLMVIVYGFIAWSLYISVSASRMVPDYTYVGLAQYTRLWEMPRWHTALGNMLIYGGMFVTISLAVGLLLAVLIDQKIRLEGVLRTVYLYPMALSLIVTGTAWKWIMNPGVGLEKFMHDQGWENFAFQWIIDRDMAIYALVIAAVWQASGFVMAMFLAGLRSVDQDIVKAAYLDGASLPRIYASIIVPSLKPVFMSAVVVLAHLAIKSFDLVIAMTNGGPGTSTDLPATFMFSMIFQRNQLGTGAASAMVMLAVVLLLMAPYLYAELKGRRHV
jgi:glucose/mannose transport system permease protein